MPDDWDILPEGRVGQDRRAQFTLPALTLSEKTSLADIAKTGVFFSYAATHSWLPQPVDPLADLLARRPDSGVQFLVWPKPPFFDGLARTAAARHWDHALLWAPAEFWPVVAAHLVACRFVDGNNTYYGQWFDITVPDAPLLWRHIQSDVPRVAAKLFCLRGPSWRMRAAIPNDAHRPVRIYKE